MDEEDPIIITLRPIQIIFDYSEDGVPKTAFIKYKNYLKVHKELKRKLSHLTFESDVINHSLMVYHRNSRDIPRYKAREIWDIVVDMEE